MYNNNNTVYIYFAIKYVHKKKNGEHFCVVYNTFVSVYGSSGFVISRFGSRVCGKEISAPIESGIF